MNDLESRNRRTAWRIRIKVNTQMTSCISSSSPPSSVIILLCQVDRKWLPYQLCPLLLHHNTKCSLTVSTQWSHNNSKSTHAQMFHLKNISGFYCYCYMSFHNNKVINDKDVIPEVGSICCAPCYYWSPTYSSFSNNLCDKESKAKGTNIRFRADWNVGHFFLCILDSYRCFIGKPPVALNLITLWRLTELARNASNAW